MVPIPKFTDQLLLEFKKDQHAKGMYVIDINPINIFHRIMIFRTGYNVLKRIYVFLFSTGATFVYMFMIAFHSSGVQMWYHDWPHIIGSGCFFKSCAPWLKISRADFTNSVVSSLEYLSAGHVHICLDGVIRNGWLKLYPLMVWTRCI